jgi:hypothetical protein
LLAVVIAFFSSAAMADNGATFANFGGTLSELQQGATGYYLSVPRSDLEGVTGMQGYGCGFGGPACSGSVSFRTAATNGLNQGLINNVNGPPTQFGAGGSFTIKERGGMGPGGTIFVGTFTSATWTFTGNASQGDYQWSLVGNVTGTLYLRNGEQMQINGATVQLTTSKMGIDPFAAPGGKINLNGGTTGFPQGVVPESSTLFLFGTGLLGIVLVARRKFLTELRT